MTIDWARQMEFAHRTVVMADFVALVVAEVRFAKSSGEGSGQLEGRHHVFAAIVNEIRVLVESWRVQSEVDSLPWRDGSDRCSPWPVRECFWLFSNQIDDSKRVYAAPIHGGCW